MKEDNRGVTLVEIVVVIAILAVLVAGVATSFGLIYSSNAKKAANEFYSLLNACRVNTVNGADSPYLELKLDTDGDYIVTLYEKNPNAADYIVHSEQEISSVNVTYTATVLAADGTLTTADDVALGSSSILLAFDRETGEFTEVPSDVDSTNGVQVEEYQLITFTAGGTEYSVKMHWQTGYIEVIK